jgi:hypothetical protein
MDPSVAFAFLQIVCILVGCGFYGLFVARRSWFPIMHRKPFLTLGTFISLSIYLISFGANSVFALSLPCWTQHLTSLATIVFYNFLVLRTFLLWFNGKLAGLRFLKITHESKSVHSWFLRNRHFVSDKYLLGFLAVSVVVFWVPSVVISLPAREALLSGSESPYNRTTFLLRCVPVGPAKQAASIVYFSLTISWIIQCVLLWKLKEIKENLHLAIELKVSCASALVLGFIAAAAAIINSQTILQLVSIAFVLSNVYSSAIIPLRTAYKVRRRTGSKFAENSVTTSSRRNMTLQLSSSSSEVRTLKDYLVELTDQLLRGDAALYEQFKRFLSSEFAIENLMFLEASSTVLKNPSMESIKSLSEFYILPGSEHEVNISSDMRKQFMIQLSQSSSALPNVQGSEPAGSHNQGELVSLVHKMQKEIFQLLRNGAFLRFKRTWMTDENASIQVEFSTGSKSKENGDNIVTEVPTIAHSNN